MKWLPVLLFLSLALVVQADLNELWGKFKSRYGLKLNSTEEPRRFSLFKNADSLIQRHNRQRNAPFKMAHNRFSVMSPREFKRYLGRRHLSKNQRRGRRLPRSADDESQFNGDFWGGGIAADRNGGLTTGRGKNSQDKPNRKQRKLRNGIKRFFNNKSAGPVSPSAGPVSPTAGGGLPAPAANSSSGPIDPSSPAYSNDTSDAFDLRQVNPACNGPVKDQKACGSCWAFAAVASVEYMQCLVTGTYREISVQQMLDCTGMTDGCAGGSPEQGFDYYKMGNPALSASSYPYWFLAANYGFNPMPICWDWMNTNNQEAIVGNMKSYTYVGGSEEKIKKAVRQGIVTNCIYVPDSGTLQLYSSGVWSDPTCGDNYSNHCTAIVGYGVDAATKRKYWIVKNEWGEDWGMGGYVLWERGTNMCQIEKDSAIHAVTVDDSS